MRVRAMDHSPKCPHCGATGDQLDLFGKSNPPLMANLSTRPLYGYHCRACETCFTFSPPEEKPTERRAIDGSPP